MLTEMDGANVDPNKIVMVLGMLSEGKHVLYFCELFLILEVMRLFLAMLIIPLEQRQLIYHGSWMTP